MQDGEDLLLLAHGGEHSLFRYRGGHAQLSNCVLRVRHKNSNTSPCSALPALAAILGAQNAPPAIATLTLPEAVATPLCESARRGETPPLPIAAAAIGAMLAAVRGEPSAAAGASACVERDHSRLSARQTDGVCIELKPKNGLLPPLAPLDGVMPRRCRFCLYADLKARRKRTPAGAQDAANDAARDTEIDVRGDDYCPLDVYACERSRAARASAALLRLPRNNLRVWDGGRLIYGGSASSTSAEAPPELETLLAALLVESDVHDVLGRLLAAQRRGAMGSLQAKAFLDRGAQLAGSEQRLAELVAERQASCACAGAACTCESPTAVQGEGPSLGECVTGLCEWLLGLAASDVSLMISLARVDAACRHGAGQSATASSLRTLTLPVGAGVDGGGGMGASAYAYRLAVVDIAAKPLRKVREHFDLDGAILQHWAPRLPASPLPSPSPPRRCHVCAPLPLQGPPPPPIGGATLVVAFGTRGDVLPLLALARRLLQQGRDGPLLFATHTCHHRLLVESLEAHAPLTFVGVPTDPLRPGMHGSSASGRAEEEYAPILSALRHCPARVDLVVFTLFSLGAWHISEALGARAIAVSPCIVPYGPPPAFAPAFAAAHPNLHAALRAAPPSLLGWAEVVGWMWPLWDADRWGEWREGALGLGRTPLAPPPHEQADVANIVLPRPTPLVYATSPALAPPPAFWPPSIRTLGFLVEPSNASLDQTRCRRDNPATSALLEGAAAAAGGAARGDSRPLYVGFGSTSPLLLLPAKGATATADDTGTADDAAPLPTALARASLAAARHRRCGLLLHCCGCEALWTCWATALREAGCSTDAVADEAARVPELAWRASVASGGSGEGDVVVVMVRGDLPLEWCLARCVAAVHHGGAGTSCSAIRANTPQLLLPLVFDQFANSERLEHAGCGVRLRRAAFDGDGGDGGGEGGEGAAELLRGLERATNSDGRASLASRREAMLAEDGLSAVTALANGTRAADSGEPIDEPKAEGPFGGATRLDGLLEAARAWKRARASGDGGEVGEAEERGMGGLEVSLAEEESMARSADCTEAATLLRLPNGLRAWCEAPSEAQHIYREIFERRCYLPDGSGLALPTDDGGDGELCIDAGANVGLFSLWAAQGAPSLRLLAIEPAPPSARLLERNVRLHSLGGRVEVACLALGAAAGRAALTYYPKMPGNSTLAPHEKAAEAQRCFRPERREEMLTVGGVYECEVAPLSRLLAEGRRAGQVVALLKLDVEGSEVEVLNGINGADWPRLRQVVVEAHGAARRDEVRTILERHYSVVGEAADEELEACGLERAVVYARKPLRA